MVVVIVTGGIFVVEKDVDVVATTVVGMGAAAVVDDDVVASSRLLLAVPFCHYHRCGSGVLALTIPPFAAGSGVVACLLSKSSTLLPLPAKYSGICFVLLVDASCFVVVRLVVVFFHFFSTNANTE